MSLFYAIRTATGGDAGLSSMLGWALLVVRRVVADFFLLLAGGQVRNVPASECGDQWAQRIHDI
jgi:hypothetical protein